MANRAADVFHGHEGPDLVLEELHYIRVAGREAGLEPLQELGCVRVRRRRAQLSVICEGGGSGVGLGWVAPVHVWASGLRLGGMGVATTKSNENTGPQEPSSARRSGCTFERKGPRDFCTLIGRGCEKPATHHVGGAKHNEVALPALVQQCLKGQFRCT